MKWLARCVCVCVCVCVYGEFGYWKERNGYGVCVFSLGSPPVNTYHSDTSSAETSRIPSYENKHHGNGEKRRKTEEEQNINGHEHLDTYAI